MVKIIKYLSAMLLVISLSLSPCSIMAYADTDNISSSYFGVYDCETDDYSRLSITGATTVLFKGRFYVYGDIACSTSTAIYFEPYRSGVADNFQVTFDTWALASGDSYVPQDGKAFFAAHYYPDEARFRVAATNATYEYYSL